MPKFLVALLAFVVVTEAHAMRWYSPNTGRWLSRDPINEIGSDMINGLEGHALADENEDANPYRFVINNPVSLVDRFGLATAGTPADDAPRDCACKCVSLTITFTPGGNDFAPDMYQHTTGDFWFGTVITMAWEVDGDPSKCRYFYKEKDGGVWGSGPKGKRSPSHGTPNQDWFEIPRVHNDSTGWFAEGPGKYTIKYNLTQTYKCVSADPTDVIVVGPKIYKKSVTRNWP